MANISGKLCIVFLFTLLTSFRDCEPKPIADMVKALQIIAKIVTDVCPSHYERVAKGCFHHRGPDIYYYNGYDLYPNGHWENARLYCQAIDGDLAIVDDIPRFLAYYKIKPNVHYYDDQMVAPFPDHHWYGAQRIGYEFQYVNGTVLPASSRLWETGHPSHGNCVALHTSTEKLVTADCSKTYYFICKSGL